MLRQPQRSTKVLLKKAKKTHIVSHASQTEAKTDIFSEGFESGIPASWLNIDSDGDSVQGGIQVLFLTLIRE